MPSTSSLLSRLERDFPSITFVKGDLFRWSPEAKAIYYESADDSASLLHEVAHAELGHGEYLFDIDLIKMERDAWEYATNTLAGRYETPIDQDAVEDMLDTYREWLHARSLCPACQANGIQIKARLYRCIACGSSWRVNEARSCALRRYTLR